MLATSARSSLAVLLLLVLSAATVLGQGQVFTYDLGKTPIRAVIRVPDPLPQFAVRNVFLYKLTDADVKFWDPNYASAVTVPAKKFQEVETDKYTFVYDG